MNKKFILFSGGTGGHVIPSVHFGNYLLSKNYECVIITDYRGLKFTNKFKGKVLKINASHLSGNIIFKVIGICKLMIGFIQSMMLVVKYKPNISISFGSYASLPPSICIVILKKIIECKYYIHEQNSVIGRSNKFFIKFSDRIFVNFNKNYNLNKIYKSKVSAVGLPCVHNNISFSKENEIKNLNNEFKIFVYGGSQGSISILNFLDDLLKNINIDLMKKLHFKIQSPKSYNKLISEKLFKHNVNFITKDFYTNISDILIKTDLIISRAGAGAINDISKYRIPSILLPLSSAKDNHQLENALMLSSIGCAIIIDEKNANIQTAKDYFIKVLTDNKNKKEIINNFKKIKQQNANELMLQYIENEY